MAGVKGRSGAKPKRKTALFREFCRDIITSKEVLESLKAEALANPIFALKLAEHGIGRPFQAVYVKGQIETYVAPTITLGGEQLFVNALSATELN